MPPVDPRILIANAIMGGVQGAFYRSTNFNVAATWVASPFALTGSVTCVALHSDDQLAVADAAQWTFAHQSDNTLASTPPPVRKLMFLRGGSEWEMDIPINLGGATYSDLQISFRNNATSAGDFLSVVGGAGTIPVVIFSGALTGTVTLKVTLSQVGRYIMVISARDGAGNSSMFEMEWLVVA